MDYTRLGSSELMVSRIALGCMGFADPGRLAPAWTLDEDATGPIFRQAVELGVTFWDTANVYSSGTSEEIVGRAIRNYARRDEAVLATKVGMRVHDGATGSGLSRAAILEQIDASLTRLGTDYVDLYQIHRFDPATPVEETMQALHQAVAAGKARYLGASSMWAWQFSKMQYTAQLHGWTGFVSMQDQYNLMEREEEREMFGLLADQNVSSIPWGPLGKGRLARPYRQQTARSEADPVGQRFVGHGDRPIIDAVQAVAQARGVPMAQVALAWVLSRPVVAAPIVGATSPGHLTDATAALDIKLTATEIDPLTEPYTPRAPSGFSQPEPRAPQSSQRRAASTRHYAPHAQQVQTSSQSSAAHGKDLGRGSDSGLSSRLNGICATASWPRPGRDNHTGWPCGSRTGAARRKKEDNDGRFPDDSRGDLVPRLAGHPG